MNYEYQSWMSHIIHIMAKSIRSDSSTEKPSDERSELAQSHYSHYSQLESNSRPNIRIRIRKRLEPRRVEDLTPQPPAEWAGPARGQLALEALIVWLGCMCTIPGFQNSRIPAMWHLGLALGLAILGLFHWSPSSHRLLLHNWYDKSRLLPIIW